VAGVALGDIDLHFARQVWLKRDGGDQPHGGSSATSPKKPRGEEQRGERRPAETDLEALEYDTLHADLLDPAPEIIAGQPTLH